MPITLPTYEKVRRDCIERFNCVLCKWQIDAALATVARQNAIVIAATGSGKSTPMLVPLLYLERGLVIIISPLNVLCVQFGDLATKHGFRSVAVTNENASEISKVCIALYSIQIQVARLLIALLET